MDGHDQHTIAVITALATAIIGLITAAVGGTISIIKALRNERDIRDTDQRVRQHEQACPKLLNGKEAGHTTPPASQ